MAGKAFDRAQIARCVQILDELAQSGQSSQDFALARGISYGQLRAWQSHAPRWRAQLAGRTYVPPAARKAAKPGGFVQLKLAPSHKAADLPTNPNAPAKVSASIRIDCTVGTRSVVLHWPTEAPAQCAQWLKAYLT